MFFRLPGLTFFKLGNLFFQAVVNMFLLQQVSLIDKQIIVFYLLCDLVNSAPEELQAMVCICVCVCVCACNSFLISALQSLVTDRNTHLSCDESPMYKTRMEFPGTDVF